MSRDEGTLLDIVRAARAIMTFMEGVTREYFLQDMKTQSAVLYQLIVIGEAVKRLSPGFRQQHAEIPWAPMAGMRDYLVHGYDVVDWEEVWATATRDVPDVLMRLESLLPRENTAEEW